MRTPWTSKELARPPSTGALSSSGHPTARLGQDVRGLHAGGSAADHDRAPASALTGASGAPRERDHASTRTDSPVGGSGRRRSARDARGRAARARPSLVPVAVGTEACPRPVRSRARATSHGPPRTRRGRASGPGPPARRGARAARARLPGGRQQAAVGTPAGAPAFAQHRPVAGARRRSARRGCSGDRRDSVPPRQVVLSGASRVLPPREDPARRPGGGAARPRRPRAARRLADEAREVDGVVPAEAAPRRTCASRARFHAIDGQRPGPRGRPRAVGRRSVRQRSDSRLRAKPRASSGQQAVEAPVRERAARPPVARAHVHVRHDQRAASRSGERQRGRAPSAAAEKPR